MLPKMRINRRLVARGFDGEAPTSPEDLAVGGQKAQGHETAERIVCRDAGQTVCCWRTQLDHFVMTRACQIAPACRFVVLSVARIDRRSGHPRGKGKGLGAWRRFWRRLGLGG